MADALSKFIGSMNFVSPYWTKAVEIVSKGGKVVAVKHEGFTWHGDREDKKNEI